MRAWSQAYRDDGLIVVGVHTPGVLLRARHRRRAARDDGSGRSTTPSRPTTSTRSGAPSPTTTGRRCTSSTATASSATSTSAREATRSPSASSRGCSASSASPSPSRAPAWRRPPTGTSLHTPETYLGAARSENFASPGGAAYDERRAYELPVHLPFNHWALAGEWTVGLENVALEEAGGSIAWRYHARDAHIVLSPGAGGPIPFRVLLDGEPPGPSHGVDVDEDGNGELREGRMYQLVREHDEVRERHGGAHVLRARRRGVLVHVRVEGRAPEPRWVSGLDRLGRWYAAGNGSLSPGAAGSDVRARSSSAALDPPKTAGRSFGHSTRCSLGNPQEPSHGPSRVRPTRSHQRARTT